MHRVSNGTETSATPHKEDVVANDRREGPIAVEGPNAQARSGPSRSVPGARCLLAALAIALLAALPDGVLLAQDGVILSRDTLHLSPDFLSHVEGAMASRGLEASDIADRVVLSRIVYESDGLRVAGYLVEPREGVGLPAVIYNRGGNREFGAHNDTTVFIGLAPLAAEGYVVAASQYRGNDGGEGVEQFGGADVNDVLSMIPLLEEHPRVDPDRIGMYGWSRGGMMTYLALTRTTRIRAAVVGAGLADAFRNVTLRPEMESGVFAELVPDWDSQREAALEARSAVRWAERIHEETPILLLHGTSDWRVDPMDAFDMGRALYEARRPFRLIVFEGGDHGLTGYRQEVHRAVVDWLNRYVRDGAPLPNLEPHGG